MRGCVKLLYYKGYSTTLDFNCTYVVHTWLWCVIITLILDGLFVLTSILWTVICCTCVLFKRIYNLCGRYLVGELNSLDCFTCLGFYHVCSFIWRGGYLMIITTYVYFCGKFVFKRLIYFDKLMFDRSLLIS